MPDPYTVPEYYRLILDLGAPEEMTDEEFEAIDTHQCDDCGTEFIDRNDVAYGQQRGIFERGMAMGHSTYAHTEDGTERLCDSCREHWCWPMDDYDTLYRTENCVYLEDRGDFATASYAEDNCYYNDGAWYTSRPNGVMCYSTKPRDYFTPDRPFGKRLIFGVELEIEAKNDVCSLLEALTGDSSDGIGQQFVCKEDGSLTDGIEVCTMPFELEVHRDGGELNWDEILTNNVKREGMSGMGTSNCGIHVHINRKALTPLTIGKMLVFVNSAKNEHELAVIAQRSDTEYTMASKKKIADGFKFGGSRYDRLNVTNERTVEVRMFRGNLRAERVRKNVEFCHAMVTYCRDCSMRDLENWGRFSRHVSQNRHHYPNLYSFMSEKGIQAA